VLSASPKIPYSATIGLIKAKEKANAEDSENSRFSAGLEGSVVDMTVLLLV
jgi:hypothetical protein